MMHDTMKHEERQQKIRGKKSGQIFTLFLFSALRRNFKSIGDGGTAQPAETAENYCTVRAGPPLHQLTFSNITADGTAEPFNQQWPLPAAPIVAAAAPRYRAPAAARRRQRRLHQPAVTSPAAMTDPPPLILPGQAPAALHAAANAPAFCRIRPSPPAMSPQPSPPQPQTSAPRFPARPMTRTTPIQPIYPIVNSKSSSSSTRKMAYMSVPRRSGGWNVDMATMITGTRHPTSRSRSIPCPVRVLSWCLKCCRRLGRCSTWRSSPSLCCLMLRRGPTSLFVPLFTEMLTIKTRTDPSVP
mmetsp:Transcript_14883/g.32389  ORF Transcript_14883/g.32389 Transcript_14883/m.32389 type:complete len:299 (+) Transcript_14883:313-1209(+)